MLNKQIFTTFSWLSIINFASLGIPFFFLPIVIGFYGPEGYGEIIFFQSLFLLISIVVSFGFNITGIEILSKARNIESATIDIYIIKLIVAFGIIFISLLIVNLFDINRVLYCLSTWVLLSEAANVQFYFQFVEKLRVYAGINIVSKSLPFIIFLIIKEYHDGLYIYPLSFMIMSFVVNCIVLTYLFYELKGSYFFKLEVILEKIVMSSKVFKVSLVGFIYASSGRVLLGFFSSSVNVGIYDLADRIFQLLKLPIGLLTQTYLVDAAKQNKPNLVRDVIRLNLVYSISAIAGVYLFGEILIDYLSQGQLLDSYRILLILAVTLMPVAISGSIASLNFLVVGKANQIFKRSLLVLVVFLACSFLFLNAFKNQLEVLVLITLFVEILFAILIYHLDQSVKKA